MTLPRTSRLRTSTATKARPKLDISSSKMTRYCSVRTNNCDDVRPVLRHWAGRAVSRCAKNLATSSAEKLMTQHLALLSNVASSGGCHRESTVVDRLLKIIMTTKTMKPYQYPSDGSVTRKIAFDRISMYSSTKRTRETYEHFLALTNVKAYATEANRPRAIRWQGKAPTARRFWSFAIKTALSGQRRNQS